MSGNINCLGKMMPGKDYNKDDGSNEDANTQQHLAYFQQTEKKKTSFISRIFLREDNMLGIYPKHKVLLILGDQHL